MVVCSRGRRSIYMYTKIAFPSAALNGRGQRLASPGVSPDIFVESHRLHLVAFLSQNTRDHRFARLLPPSRRDGLLPLPFPRARMLRSENTTGWSLSYLEDYGPSTTSPQLYSGGHYPSSRGVGMSLLACPELLSVYHYQFPKVGSANPEARLARVLVIFILWVIL